MRRIALCLLLSGCELLDKLGDSGFGVDNPCIASAESDSSGERVYASGGAVDAIFQGGNAGYDNDVWLDAPSTVHIGQLHTDAPGSQVSLGSFSVGDELVFRIDTPDGFSWYTGPASRNADGLAHARVVRLDNGEYHIGFEDLEGGGDGDFDDTCIVVTGSVSLLGR